MSGPRKALWGILLVALVGAIVYAASVYRKPPVHQPKIVFIAGGTSAYWDTVISGAEAAARDFNVDMRVETTASENLAEQMAILGKLDLDTVDGIALSPLDETRATEAINRLVQQQKKVVAYDSDAPHSARHIYVGTNNYGAGQTVAELVKEAIPEGGKVAVLLANFTKVNMLDRKDGFEVGLAKPAAEPEEGEEGQGAKFEVVGYYADEGSDEKCAQIIRDTLKEHPDLACFVGMAAQHGPALLNVLREEDKLGQIKLVTFDVEEETLKGIEDGHIYATLAQDPFKYAYDSIAILDSLCRGDPTIVPIVGRGSLSVIAEPIKIDNLSVFRARFKERQQAVEDRRGENP
jgi:ribose transport system substrate-binding protein